MLQRNHHVCITLSSHLVSQSNKLKTSSSSQILTGLQFRNLPASSPLANILGSIGPTETAPAMLLISQVAAHVATFIRPWPSGNNQWWEWWNRWFGAGMAHTFFESCKLPFKTWVRTELFWEIDQTNKFCRLWENQCYMGVNWSIKLLNKKIKVQWIKEWNQQTSNEEANNYARIVRTVNRHAILTQYVSISIPAKA